MTNDHELIGENSLIFVSIILVTLFSGKILSVLQLHHITESFVSICFGVIIGLFALTQPNPNAKSFKPEFFFYVLLPPIVFEAGFSMRKKNFFHNMSTILVFAILGTLISTFIIGFGLYALSFANFTTLNNNNNPIEALIFGALISAVDPVGTLAVLGVYIYLLSVQTNINYIIITVSYHKIILNTGKKELNIDPTLYSVIFGESVLNDAVSIVLYKLFSNYMNENISFENYFFEMFGKFIGIFIGSLLLGVLVALLSSLILKQFPNLFRVLNNKINKSQINLRQQSSPEFIEMDEFNKNNDNNNNDNISDNEGTNDDDNDNNDINTNDLIKEVMSNDKEYVAFEFAYIILFSYLSYSLSEVLHLSGIVSVFFCGISMSHYTWYNLSNIAQISLEYVILGLAKCSENFVYAYLGIQLVLSIANKKGNYEWHFQTIVFTLLLCLLSRALNIFPFSFLINLRRKNKITLDMQIMIWFSGLRGAICFAMALNMKTPHSNIIITTTLMIVIITTIVLGILTPEMIKKFHLSNIFPTSTTNFKSPKNYSKFHVWWRNFDDNIMKKYFGGSKRSIHTNIPIQIPVHSTELSLIKIEHNAVSVSPIHD